MREDSSVQKCLSQGSCNEFKRSYAIRVKRQNLNNSVPSPIREFILSSSSRSADQEQTESTGGTSEDENLTLAEQIRRGVKLNPVQARQNHHQIALRLTENKEKTVYELLVEALAKRNSVMQLSSDEEDEEDQPDGSTTIIHTTATMSVARLSKVGSS